MQIKLKELLENMTADGGQPAAAADESGGGGVVETPVEDGPSVASACPPTPRRSISTIQAAIDAASIEMEAQSQVDFFNPPPDPPRNTTELDAADVEEQDEVVSHRRHRRTTPPPPPPRRDADEPAAAESVADQPTAPSARSSGAMEATAGEDEYEPQTFSPGMLSPLSRRPSGVNEVVKPPRRDSGLIDVRSMAAAYREYDGLVKKQKDARSSDVETVPLPILGGSDHTSPILLPQPAAEGQPSRWLYALVAVLGLIVVVGSTVAITALVLKHRGGGAKSFAALSPGDRAALCAAEADRVRDDEERIAAARRAPASVPGAESDEVTAADEAAVPPAAPAPVAPVASSSASSAPAASSSSSADDDRRHHRHHGEDGSSSSASTSTSPSATASSPTASSTPAATPPATPPASDDLAAAAGSATAAPSSDGDKCDEVECLVSGKGCCGKNPKGAGAKSDAPPADPSLPARPERADISAGVSSVQGRLQSCGDRHSVRGAVTVKLSIAPSGEVKSASTTQGSSEFQSCIAGALKGARFPATQQGARVSYPVVLK